MKMRDSKNEEARTTPDEKDTFLNNKMADGKHAIFLLQRQTHNF
jgi:hypothetical protein